MNLKEAFRYQNKLGSLMEEAQSILGLEGNITRIENTYLRKKVFDGAENETVIDTPPTEFADRITDIVRFLMALMEQREVLSKAIHAAKNALPIDMDSEVGLNARRQEIARKINSLKEALSTCSSARRSYMPTSFPSFMTYKIPTLLPAASGSGTSSDSSILVVMLSSLPFCTRQVTLSALTTLISCGVPRSTRILVIASSFSAITLLPKFAKP